MATTANAVAADLGVIVVSDLAVESMANLLARFQLELVLLPPGAAIDGSYWGAPEAGIVGHRVYVRPDTPVHSLLHETCHAVCMTSDRRAVLHTNAGGDDLEESAVCYLQMVLADCLPGVSQERLARDMDTWGYSFRLGSTARWFQSDASDARDWLTGRGLLTAHGQPRWILRQG